MSTSLLLGPLIATLLTAPRLADAALPDEPVRPVEESVERIRVDTADGVALAAVFYRPPDGASRTKASGAVLVHAAGADKSGLDELAKYLQRKGFGVLALDLRGHGESAGSAGDWKTLDAAAQASCWAEAVRDLEAASAFLRACPELQSNTVSVIGVGSGAELAVRHALNDATVSALVLIGNSPDSFAEGVVANLGQLAGLPTLVVASKDRRDEATRLQRGAQRAGGKASGVEIEIVKAEPETLLADAGMRAVLATWLREKLRPRR